MSTLRIWPKSGILVPKQYDCMWHCAGIYPVWSALQTW